MNRGGRRSLPLAALGLGVLAIVVIVALLLALLVADPGADPAGPPDVEPSTPPAPAAIAEKTEVAPAEPARLRTGVDARRTLVVELLRWPEMKPLTWADLVLTDVGGAGRQTRHTSGGSHRVELVVSDRTPMLTVRAEASGYLPAEHSVHFTGDATRQEIRLELMPDGGLLGRVVSELGDPVPDVEVHIWRHWPARPTLLLADDPQAMPELAALAPRAEWLMKRVTGPSGGYHLPEPEEVPVADLVLAVVGGTRTSLPMRLALPWPGGELPLLVARRMEPLELTIVDGTGMPIPGADVELDLAPGSRRQVSESWNRYVPRWPVPRHLGTVHLHVRHEAYWFAAALEGDRVLETRVVPEPPPRFGDLSRRRHIPRPEPWITVDGGTRDLTVVLAEGGRVNVQVRDAGSGAGVAGLEVLVHAPSGATLGRSQPERGDLLARGRSDEDGHVVLHVPPEHAGATVIVSVNEHGWTPARAEAVPALGPGSERVHLPVLPESTGTVLVRQLTGMGMRRSEEQPSTRLLAWLTDDSPLLEAAIVPPDAQRLRLADASAREQPIPVDLKDDRRLLLVQRREDAEGNVAVDSWGPLPLDVALQAPVVLSAWGLERIDVQLAGETEGRPLAVETTSWLPWLAELLVRAHGVQQQPRRPLSVRASVPDDSWTLVELTEGRRPVRSRLDGVGGWLTREAGDPPMALTLTIPATHLVQGRVRRVSVEQPADLLVSLVGRGTAVWRHTMYGQDDHWARPDGNGMFRFEAVPDGTYQFILSLAHEDGSVTVMARRQVTVNATLFNLDIEPDPGGEAAWLRLPAEAERWSGDGR